MLLALDVGNTQTVVGMYDGEALREHWRTTTVRTHTGDELALMLVGLLELRKHTLASIDAVVGWAGLVDGLVRRFRAELGVEATTIATGGLAALVAPHCETIQHVEQW